MSILVPNSNFLCREIYQNNHQPQPCQGGNSLVLLNSYRFFGFDGRKGNLNKIAKRGFRVEAFSQGSSRPIFVEMQSIDDYDQFDRILLKAQELSQPIIVYWMASWCRKCIYLKPKVEKLAMTTEYDAKVKFYSVDVNKVPQALVKRGNISNIPTIQLWKDGEMKAEVIGGHTASLVLDKIKEMIQNLYKILCLPSSSQCH